MRMKAVKAKERRTVTQSFNKELDVDLPSCVEEGLLDDDKYKFFTKR